MNTMKKYLETKPVVLDCNSSLFNSILYNYNFTNTRTLLEKVEKRTNSNKRMKE